MIFDYKEDTCKYVVHSKKNGNEFAISFTSMDQLESNSTEDSTRSL